MKSYEEVLKVVESKLSDYRLKHSISTMERCVEYAKMYGVDVEKARLVGIAHDILKETPKGERIIEAEMLGVELDEIEKAAAGLIHAKSGAKYCEINFGFSEDMVNAIKYHTTGRANMTMLEKIMYLADGTGEDREYEEAEIAYEIAKKDLDEALLYFFKKTVEWTVQDNKLIHIDTINAYNYLINNK